MNLSRFWESFYGRTVLITTLENRNRKSSAIRNLENAGFKCDENNIQIAEFPRHPTSGRDGCRISHITSIQRAMKLGLKYLLVFEDDIDINWSQVNETALAECIDMLKSLQFDLLYLGYFPWYISAHKQYKNIVECRGFCTHAYIINLDCDFARTVVAHLDYVDHIDLMFVNEVSRAFALFPSFCVQDQRFESDIKWDLEFRMFRDGMFQYIPFLEKHIIPHLSKALPGSRKRNSIQWFMQGVILFFIVNIYRISKHSQSQLLLIMCSLLIFWIFYFYNILIY